MNRNSNIVFIESPSSDSNYPCITPIPWINSAPDFTGITEPTLSILQASWQAFVASGDELVVIADPVPTPVIRTIDMRRLRLALFQLNLLDDIDTAIAAQSKSAQIEWEFATDVKADHPLVVQLATTMSLDVDAIFDLAETYE